MSDIYLFFFFLLPIRNVILNGTSVFLMYVNHKKTPRGKILAKNTIKKNKIITIQPKKSIRISIKLVTPATFKSYGEIFSDTPR